MTTVGSTQGQGPETAASFTSGGFSNIFPRPSYQDAAVERYLDAQGSTYKGRYNASGRAYPDVATQGVRFAVQINGELVPVSGTSASAPTFAAIVSLLNDQLLGAGRSALGFLNPMLYQQGAAAMNDITSGSNPGCGTNGFEARAGWDPVSAPFWWMVLCGRDLTYWGAIRSLGSGRPTSTSSSRPSLATLPLLPRLRRIGARGRMLRACR